MDKSFMFFIAVGIGFLYFITNFVGDIQAEDDKYANEAYAEEHKYDAYQSVDSIGREILDLTGASASVQMEAWNSSRLKEDFLILFPDFSEMKVFVEERVRGKVLKEKLMKTIDAVETQYFSGTLNIEDAKRMLSTLK